VYRIGYGATGLLVAGVLAACGSVSPYRSTAAELVRTEHFVSTDFSMTWTPLDRDAEKSLSEDDESRRRFWLDSCVNELSARFAYAPGNAVRAVQIAECMYVRGWHLNVRDSVAER
jgi:hypothetical protein